MKKESTVALLGKRDQKPEAGSKDIREKMIIYTLIIRRQ